MYKCIYIYIHMYIHTYIYVLIRTYICILMNAYVHTCIYMHVHIYVYTYIYVSICIYKYLYIYAYTYVYINMYVHYRSHEELLKLPSALFYDNTLVAAANSKNTHDLLGAASVIVKVFICGKGSYMHIQSFL